MPRSARTLVILLLAVQAAAAPAARTAKPAPAAPQDRDAPSIVHNAVREAVIRQELVFEAEIADESGVFEPNVSWRHPGQAWNIMTLANTGGDHFAAKLPAEMVTADIEYFIEAYDTVGNGPVRYGSAQKPLLIAVGVAKAAPAPALPPPPPQVVLVREELAAPTPIAPYLTMGSGALLLAVGAALWFGASSDAEALRGRYSQGGLIKTADVDEAKGIATRSRIASVLMISGALAGAGGTAWWLLMPAPSPGGASLQLAVGF